MPIQSSAWSDFLSCPMCYQPFNGSLRAPISLGCGHTLCEVCINKLRSNQCPFDQLEVNVKLSQLPVNPAILCLLDHDHQAYRHEHRNSPAKSRKEWHHPPECVPQEHITTYITSVEIMCKLAYFLKPMVGGSNSYNNSNMGGLSRSMQRKLITLINCQLLEKEGRARAVRAARSLGERTVTELILHHQNHQQLSANLWAAVRARGCQFLGPAMQEEVIKLVLLALEDGSPLSRKVLVMFVVQRLEPHFPQASKTSIGHVVQLLYRASCFKVSKRDRDSSLMQLKEEFRCYDSLRREHDTQIVQIATEAGLRIAPDQWSSLLYGDVSHKSHMQSIMDKLQTPQSFAQSINELQFVLQRTGDPSHLYKLWPHLELLASLDAGSPLTNGSSTSPSEQTIEIGSKTSSDKELPELEVDSDREESPKTGDSVTTISVNGGKTETVSWSLCGDGLRAVHFVLLGLVQFLQHSQHRRLHDHLQHNTYSKTRLLPPRQAFTQHRRNIPYNSPNNRPRPNQTAAVFKPQTYSKQYASENESPNSSHDGGKNDLDVEEHSNLQYSNNHDESLSQLTKGDQYIGDNQRNSRELSFSSPRSDDGSNKSVTTCSSSPHSKTNDTHADGNENLRIYGYNAIVDPRAQYQADCIAGSIFSDSDGSSIGGYTDIEFNSPYHAFSPVPPPRVVVPSPAMIGSGPVYPQAHTPLLTTTDIYPTVATPQAVIMNPIAPGPPPVFNMVPSNLEFVFPVNEGHGGHMGTSQTLFPSLTPLQPLAQPIPTPNLFPQPAFVGQWYGISPFIPQNTLEETNAGVHLDDNLGYESHRSNNITPTSLAPNTLKKKSLSELREIKHSIVSRLIDIVGEKQTEEVEELIAKNQSHIPCVIPTTTVDSSSDGPTYSIWTSGHEFYKSCRIALRTTASDIDSSSRPDSADGSAYEHGMGGSGLVGRSGMHSSRPIQVSASTDVSYTTTSTLDTNCSLIALPPMPHQAVMYPAGHQVPGLACPSYGLYPTPLPDMPNATALNTIQHGILDPPHLRMAQLDPSGARPSDPIDPKLGTHNFGQWEERQRQHLNAVTDGIDPFCSIKNMPEEHRLKQELSFVMHGISEKLNIQDVAAS
ncbi:roquin-2 isoform X2 [Hyalella azteca]|uniref:RING-type E3 ubiquitin transferase n=1 Tax=Hyalella azteca TaxID=294128 RepID=A0A8B7P7Z3_HYAAZ|nr:roquin-2 isoform X2 [Hyalella azteca]